MKILAIIPARAGSRGIPNKNIRILAGKPMVRYAIENALNSEWITDVIVSSDSEEVISIARQLGVDVHRRDERLCRDDVTLDAVIYDAIPKDVTWDYIVTLQPTSPTLRAKTLDKAIKHAVEGDYDTVISVKNNPHLSWRDENGKRVPNYKERLNRQYLPANYVETGAFVIAKASIVSPETRFGECVDVYEIPEKEAVDVDNYIDLAVVKDILTQKSVAFYVNGNNKRGLGHIYRTLELADEFNVKPDIYFDINQTEEASFGDTKHNLIPVNGITELFERCKKEQYEIFINDILTTSIDYMIGLKTSLPNAKIVNIEDDGEGAIAADAVFNALYGRDGLENAYGGEEYFIPGKQFLYYSPIEINETAKTMFVCFGGADPKNYTDRVLDMVSKEEYKDYNFIVVIGRAKQNIQELLKYNEYDNIEVYHDVSNMPELMSRCDFALTSRGRTCYELAILGIPTISMAENDRENRHGFVSDENGFTYLGIEPDDEIIEEHIKIYFGMSRNVRQRYQNMLLQHNLRNGRKRFMDVINAL